MTGWGGSLSLALLAWAGVVAGGSLPASGAPVAREGDGSLGVPAWLVAALAGVVVLAGGGGAAALTAYSRTKKRRAAR
jgi:hypothetical protein